MAKTEIRSISLPIKCRKNDARMVASEQIKAKWVFVIIADWQILDLNKDIKNVWPGAEKKTPEMEKIKNSGLNLNKR